MIRKWHTPNEWLMWYIGYTDDRWERLELIDKIVPHLDSDLIQNLFQDEMEQYGYFEEVNDSFECPECGYEWSALSVDGIYVQNTGECPECGEEVENE